MFKKLQQLAVKKYESECRDMERIIALFLFFFCSVRISMRGTKSISLSDSSSIKLLIEFIVDRNQVSLLAKCEIENRKKFLVIALLAISRTRKYGDSATNDMIQQKQFRIKVFVL